MRFMIPAGETIIVNPGKYRFDGPMLVLKDPSFNWPVSFVSGNLIDYSYTGEEDAEKSDSNLRDGASSGDISIHSTNGGGTPKKRRANRDSSLSESSGEVGQSEVTRGEQGREDSIRGRLGESKEIQISSNEDTKQT